LEKGEKMGQRFGKAGVTNTETALYVIANNIDDIETEITNLTAELRRLESELSRIASKV
jgi:hypothetical protein